MHGHILKVNLQFEQFGILVWTDNTFSVMSGLFLSFISAKQRVMCLAIGHNTDSPVRLEPATARSLVERSKTEPLRQGTLVLLFSVLQNSPFSF